MRAPKHINGFTLMELLAVIAIILLIASLMLPAIGKVSSRTKADACRANLRQIGLGLNLYVQETDAYPLYGRPASVVEVFGAKWYDDLIPYVSARWSNGVLVCPAYRKTVEDNRSTRWNIFASLGSYAYNGGSADDTDQYMYGLAGKYAAQAKLGKMPVLESEIVIPSDMIALADSYSRIYPTEPDTREVCEGLDFLTRRLHRLDVQDLITDLKGASKRHTGRAHTAFCDGHIESLPLRDMFFSRSVRHLRRWHADNEAHDELFR